MYSDTQLEKSVALSTSSRKWISDLAIVSLIVLLPVLFYWISWVMYYLAHDNPAERVMLFFALIPRQVLGISSHWIVLLLSFLSLVLGVLEKLSRGTSWYSSATHIQLAIIAPMLMLLISVLQIMM